MRYIIMQWAAKNIPDIGVLSCPSAESFKLALGLTHPCTEEVEFAQGLRLGFGIGIGWVETKTTTI